MSNILIIDDDDDIRDMITIYLENASHTVTQASQGQDGVDLAKLSVPDLIILDINMPVMDGTRVIKELRDNQSTAKVPVIALSAMNDTHMRDDMYQMGCDAYIIKPIDFEVLQAKIASLISH
ncbi:MAG: response regulator [Magnetovibrio sp.]|nr:response regulator [Magnetovibrio sp.]